MPELGRHFFWDVAFCTERDLSKWIPLLRRGLDDQWVQQDKQAAVGAPTAMPTPKVQVCPVYYHKFQQDYPELCTFIIVQGKEGAAIAKMVIKHDISQMASQLFFEASNGFNVVFSGVMRKDDVVRLGNQELPLKQANKLDDLLSNTEKDNTAQLSPSDCILVYF
jgi:hypothetical protein